MTKRRKLEARLNRIDECLGKWKCECCRQTYFRQAGQEPAASRYAKRWIHYHYLGPRQYSVIEYVCEDCHDSWETEGD